MRTHETVFACSMNSVHMGPRSNLSRKEKMGKNLVTLRVCILKIKLLTPGVWGVSKILEPKQPRDLLRVCQPSTPGEELQLKYSDGRRGERVSAKGEKNH